MYGVVHTLIAFRLKIHLVHHAEQDFAPFRQKAAEICSTSTGVGAENAKADARNIRTLSYNRNPSCFRYTKQQEVKFE